MKKRAKFSGKLVFKLALVLIMVFLVALLFIPQSANFLNTFEKKAFGAFSSNVIYSQVIPNPGHGGDEVFIYVNGDSKSLQQAIIDGEFDSDFTGAGSYSDSFIHGHKGEEIIVNVGGAVKSFQDAISDGTLCNFEGGTNSDFGVITGQKQTGDEIWISITEEVVSHELTYEVITVVNADGAGGPHLTGNDACTKNGYDSCVLVLSGIIGAHDDGYTTLNADCDYVFADGRHSRPVLKVNCSKDIPTVGDVGVVEKTLQQSINDGDFYRCSPISPRCAGEVVSLDVQWALSHGCGGSFKIEGISVGSGSSGTLNTATIDIPAGSNPYMKLNYDRGHSHPTCCAEVRVSLSGSDVFADGSQEVLSNLSTWSGSPGLRSRTWIDLIPGADCLESTDDRYLSLSYSTPIPLCP